MNLNLVDVVNIVCEGLTDPAEKSCVCISFSIVIFDKVEEGNSKTKEAHFIFWQSKEGYSREGLFFSGDADTIPPSPDKYSRLGLGADWGSLVMNEFNKLRKTLGAKYLSNVFMTPKLKSICITPLTEEIRKVA